MALDFTGAVPDALHPGIAPKALNRQLAHQAHAAENLQGLVGDAGQRLGGEQLGHGRVRIGHAALVALPGGLQGQQLSRLQVGGHVGQLETRTLKAPNRLPKLLPRGRPLGGHVQHPAPASDAGRGHGEPGGAQPLTHQVKALALLAQSVAHRHPAVAEKQLALVVAAVRNAGRATTHRQARAVQIDQKPSDFFLGPMGRFFHVGRGK